MFLQTIHIILYFNFTLKQSILKFITTILTKI